MDIETCAEVAQNKTALVIYPERQRKPIKENGESNAAYGKRLDEWDSKIVVWRVTEKMYHDKLRQINDEFKANLRVALGLQKYAKWDKLFDKAWEDSHSDGYLQVAQTAEELAELVK